MKRVEIAQLTIYQRERPLPSIVTKFHPMTAASNKARVSARCSVGRIFLPWDNNKSKEHNFRAAAQALCAKFKWKGPLVHGMLDDDSHVFVQAPEISMDHSNETSIIPGSELREFTVYLGNCTDAQVRGVYKKEKAAGRDMYAILAEQEAGHRGIDL